MKKATVVVLAIASLAVAAPSSAVGMQRAPESCLAANPAQSTCTFTVTSASSSGTVTGAVGSGDWVVVVKRGKAKLTFKPPGAEPNPVSFTYQPGDKVTATVKSAGGWVLAGHD
jgi:hypothetical protein